MGLTAFALAAGGAYAASGLSSMMRTSAEEDSSVSATWHLGEKVFSDVTADVSDADVISSSNLSYEGLTSNKVRTAKPTSGEIKLTTWNASISATPVESDFVKFTITTEVPFTPTLLTLNSGAIKTGNARMDIVAEIGGTSYSIAKGIIPARVEENEEKDADKDYTLSYELTDIPAVKGELALKFYLYGDAGKAREVGLSEVCISGTTDNISADPIEVPEGWMTMPGEIDINHPSWVYDGLRIENNGDNIGWARNGCSATGQIFVKEGGVYQLHMDFYWFQNESDFEIEITDMATGKKEVDTFYHIYGIHKADIYLEGYLTPGKKIIKYTFHSESGGWLANYKSHSSTKIGDKFAVLSDVSVDGIDPIDFEGYDYTFNLPMDYAKEYVTLKTTYRDAILKAKIGETELPVGEDGTIEVPTPGEGEACEVVLTLDVEEGTATKQTEYKVRIFHIGGIVLTGLTLDGLEADEKCIEDFNREKKGINIDGYVFTSLPEVIATFIDGASIKAVGEMTGENTATYTFEGTAGTLKEEFSFTLPGVYIYVPSENDKKDVLKYDSGYNGADGIWNNGLYSINANDGWTGTQFKMKNNVPIVLTPPSDMKIKQFVMAALYDNYTPGRVASITSEGATLRVPTARSFQTGVDNDHALNLVVNVENHIPGTPFVIEFEGGGQPVAWFEFVYETVVPTTAPEVEKTTATTVEDRNHAVVTFQFNRAMNETSITVNGTEVKAEGGNTSLNFPIWDLPYNTEVEVTIPAGAATDTYGNATDRAFTHILNVGSPAAVIPIDAERFVTVSNTEELRAAVDALKTTNSKRDDLQTIIYVLNGDYDLGETILPINKVYNVSLIGESQNGVLIHGYQTGITNPVVSTRSSANIFMENLTIRNDLDFGKSDRVGVGVAHYGGELDILKNVTLQSVQDTEVTGDRGYWKNVTIHGSADYICGGGDHYFDNCTLINEFAKGYIVAPATSPANKYGYVFQHCTIDGESPYYLGRPWSNEPRTFFLNTTMNVLPFDEGWGRMSDLTTHLFEYNSMDAEGNALDLSKRTNSPSSTNTYSPILPEEYADHFTVRNVLGGLNSWDAEALVVECAAPAATLDENGIITWETVEGAAGYIVYYDGKFAGYTTETSFTTESSADMKLYSLAAINQNGCLGKIASLATTGINTISGNANQTEYYNLQGVCVSDDAKGVVIKVTRTADGSVLREKIVRK